MVYSKPTLRFAPVNVDQSSPRRTSLPDSEHRSYYSLTESTGRSDSEPTTFDFGGDSHSESYGMTALEVTVLGLTKDTAEEKEERDVQLEALQVDKDGTTLIGVVRVRNIAFEKSVAVRFTCDRWQTTSEIEARYMEGLPGHAHDLFRFTIRLNTFPQPLDKRTMFFAVRYIAAGKEMWDNNDGVNYQVIFARRGLRDVESVADMTVSMAAFFRGKAENLTEHPTCSPSRALACGPQTRARRSTSQARTHRMTEIHFRQTVPPTPPCCEPAHRRAPSLFLRTTQPIATGVPKVSGCITWTQDHITSAQTRRTQMRTTPAQTPIRPSQDGSEYARSLAVRP